MGLPPDGFRTGSFELGADGKAGDQLDAAPANFVARRMFAEGLGPLRHEVSPLVEEMSPWRHGNFCSSIIQLDCPICDQARRMSSSGIQCRIWPRGTQGFLEGKVKKTENGFRLVRALRLMTSAGILLLALYSLFCQEIAKDECARVSPKRGRPHHSDGASGIKRLENNYSLKYGSIFVR